jgi:hypothetical protein
MANSTTVNTCPLFPELENEKSYGSIDPKTGQLNIPGIFSVDTNSILPQGVGSGTASTSYNISYDATMWQSTALRNYEFELHEKYPALQQAWEHYQNILRMCKSREEETGENRL